jgi:hypothetical protein
MHSTKLVFPTLARMPRRANHELIGLDSQLNFVAETKLLQPNLGNPDAAGVPDLDQMRLSHVAHAITLPAFNTSAFCTTK